MRLVGCPHPTHAARAGQPGHNDVLGRRDELPDGPMVFIDGLFCGACGRVVLDSRIVETEAERVARVAAINKFLLANPTFTRAELRRLLASRDDD